MILAPHLAPQSAAKITLLKTPQGGWGGDTLVEGVEHVEGYGEKTGVVYLKLNIFLRYVIVQLSSLVMK